MMATSPSRNDSEALDDVVDPSPTSGAPATAHFEAIDHYHADNSNENRSSGQRRQDTLTPTVQGRQITFETRIFNSFLTCKLCEGYLIDATTIDPCLHTFCKACIYKHWRLLPENAKCCPTCREPLTVNPLQHLKPDRTMQNLAYLVVPGLEAKEQQMMREVMSESHNG